MVQILPSQPSVFGRLGQGLAKGLSETVPQEIERARLSKGLQSLEKESGNLSPMQFITRAAAIPGITPQTLQSLTELSKQQNLGSAYSRSAFQNANRPILSAAPSVEELQTRANRYLSTQQQTKQLPPSVGQPQTPYIPPGNAKQPHIVETNPLAENQLTQPPWSPEKRNQRIAEYIGNGFLPEQARELAAEDQANELATPAAYQARTKELQEAQNTVKGKFRDLLAQKLGVTGADKEEKIFSKLPGEYIAKMEQGMERDLRTNLEATPDSVAQDWSQRAVELDKARTKFLQKTSTKGISEFGKGNQLYNSLTQYSKIYADAANSDQYYDELIAYMDASPLGAAHLAYKESPSLKSGIEKLSVGNFKGIKGIEKRGDLARRAADQVEKFIKPEDSILSAAYALRKKFPNFDMEAFFEQLGNDGFGANDRQRREVAEGASDILPFW